MARLAFTGFEWQSSAEFYWSLGTFSFSTTTVNPGGSVASLRANPTGTAIGYVQLAKPSATGVLANMAFGGTLYASGYFRYATKPTTNYEPLFLAYNNGGAGTKGSVALNSTGTLAFYDSAGSLVATGATVLSANTWYLLDIKIGQGASGAYEVRINGVSEISGTANVETTNHDVVYLGKVSNANGNTVDFFFDDWWLDDAAYKGAHVVVAKHPNANGSTQQFTAGTGASDYQEVDEAVPASADYVQSVASGDVALFDLEDSATAPAVSGTIHGVLALTRRSISGGAGGDFVNVRIRSNATNSDTSVETTNVGLNTRGKYADVDPDTAAAWTTGGLNAVEVGAVSNLTTAVMLLSTATLMVSFTAAAGGRGLFRTAHLDGLSAAGSFFADPLGG